MQKFKVDLEDGRSFIFEGEQPPSEKDVNDYLSSQTQAQPKPDLIGRAKEWLLSGKPQQHSLFGETTLPGEIVQGVGQAMLPESWTGLGVQGAAAAGAGLLGKALGPLTRAAKNRTVAGALGQPANVIERAGVQQSARQGAYAAAESLATPTSTGSLKGVLEAVANDSQLEEGARNGLQQLLKTHPALQGESAPYNAVVDLEQKLGELINGPYENSTKALLKTVRGASIRAADAVSPALSQANKITAFNTAAEDIMKIVETGSKSINNLGRFDRLISNKPYYIQSLGGEQAAQLIRNAVQRGATADMIGSIMKSIAHTAGWLGGGYLVGRGHGGGGGY